MDGNQLSALGIKDTDQYENYWFVRSNKGRFYNDFAINQYIAIGWDYIGIGQFKSAPEIAVKQIIENSLVEETDEDGMDSELDDGDNEGSSRATDRKVKNNITGIYNKINRFINEMKIGDLVLVPSRNSLEVSVGTIISDAYEEPSYIVDYHRQNPDTELNLCHYTKRRKVKWIKTLQRPNLDVYLTKAFSSQHALSNMRDYAPFIDRAVFPLYKKNDKIHATFHAGHPDGMSLSQLSNIIKTIEESVTDISSQLENPLSGDDIKIKLNIHSPGIIEIIVASVLSGGAAAAMIIHALNHYKNGGKSSISLKFDSITQQFGFTIDSESKGSRGRDVEERQIVLHHDENMRQLAQGIEVDTKLIGSQSAIVHLDEESSGDDTEA